MKFSNKRVPAEMYKHGTQYWACVFSGIIVSRYSNFHYVFLKYLFDRLHSAYVMFTCQFFTRWDQFRELNQKVQTQFIMTNHYQLLLLPRKALQSPSSSDREFFVLHLRHTHVSSACLHSFVGICTSFRNQSSLHHSDFSHRLCVLHNLRWAQVDFLEFSRDLERNLFENLNILR